MRGVIMNAIETIKQKFAKYPSVSYQYDKNSIWVPKTTDEGFDVTLEICGDQLQVSYDSWHERFESEKKAVDRFGFGLTDNCRLVVYSKGRFEYKWTAQFLSHGEWHDDSTTGLLVYPFWRRTSVSYRKNNHIPISSAK